MKWRLYGVTCGACWLGWLAAAASSAVVVVVILLIF